MSAFFPSYFSKIILIFEQLYEKKNHKKALKSQREKNDTRDVWQEQKIIWQIKQKNY